MYVPFLTFYKTIFFACLADGPIYVAQVYIGELCQVSGIGLGQCLKSKRFLRIFSFYKNILKIIAIQGTRVA